MNPIINISIEAARIAGRIIMQAYDRLDTVTVMTKSLNDFATDVDHRAEQAVIMHLEKAYPEYGFIAEESGNIREDASHVWIIDPLDGTRNFMHGFPHFAVSIALQVHGKIEHGLIYDPVRQEFFTASRGKGSYLNNKRIRVSARLKLEQALLGTGFPFRHQEEAKTLYFNLLKVLLPESGDLRRAGSATLDLAYVAAGRLDGFFELQLKPWDIAAGSLLIKEAGGLITDLNGSEDYLQNGNVIASNPKLFKHILKAVKTCC